MSKMTNQSNGRYLPKTLGAFVWHMAAPQTWGLFAICLTGLIWAIEMSLSPYLLKLIIDTATQFQHSPQMFLSAILVPIVLYGSMSFILNINFRIYEYVYLKVIPSIKANTTRVMFDYLTKHSHSYFLSHFAGSLAKKLNDMAHNIEPVIRMIVNMFLPRVMALIIACGMLWFVNPVFSIILAVWSVCYTLMTFYFAKHSQAKARNMSEAAVVLNGTIVDAVTNIISAKIFSNIAYEKEKVDQKLTHIVQQDRDLQWYLLKIHFVEALTITLFIGCMLAALVYGFMHGKVTIGDFALVLTLSIAFLIHTSEIGHAMLQFSTSVGICEQALSIITDHAK